MAESLITVTGEVLTGETAKDALMASANAKLARADKHLDALYRKTDGWGDGDPLAIVRDSNADGSEHIFRIRYKVQPDLWKWALILGDALHNLRGALDHTVYALATAQTRKDPPDDETKLAFPICSESKFFKGQRHRIASLTEPTQAAIEKAQPYNRLDRWKGFAPLWWLAQLHDIDKHRLSHLATSAARHDDLAIDAVPGTYRAFWNTGALVDGAPLLRLLMDPPNPNVYVDLNATAAVVLDFEGQPPVSLYWTTQHMRREVRTICRYLRRYLPY